MQCIHPLCIQDPFLKRGLQLGIIDDHGHFIHVRGSQQFGLRMLQKERIYGGRMPQMRFAKRGTHVLVKLLVEFDVRDDLFERGQRLHQVQHAEFVVFILNDLMVRGKIGIGCSDAGFIQQRLAVQERHDGQQHGFDGLAPGPLVSAPRVQNAHAHFPIFIQVGVHASGAVVR